MFLDCHREIGAAFDCGVVGCDDAGSSRYVADAADQAGSGDLVVVHPAGGQGTELEPWGIRIEQRFDPLPSSQLAALFVERNGLVSPTRPNEGEMLLEIGSQAFVVSPIRCEFFGCSNERGLED